MKNYVKIAEDLILQKKQEEQDNHNKKQKKDEAISLEIKECKKYIKEGLKQFHGKYGIKVSKDFKVDQKGEAIALIEVSWASWVMTNDNVDSEESGLKIIANYPAETSSYGSRNMNYKQEICGWGPKETAEDFLESFARQISKYLEK